MGACTDKAKAILVSAAIEKGNVTQTNLNYSKTNATCMDSASSVSPTIGSVAITSLTSSRVTGIVTMAFRDGSSFSESFDVAICGVSFNVCDVGSCSGTGTCVP